MTDIREPGIDDLVSPERQETLARVCAELFEKVIASPDPPIIKYRQEVRRLFPDSPPIYIGKQPGAFVMDTSWEVVESIPYLSPISADARLRVLNDERTVALLREVWEGGDLFHFPLFNESGETIKSPDFADVAPHLLDRLLHLISRSIEKSERLSFDPAQLLKIFAQGKRHELSPTIPCTMIAPLVNFFAEECPVELGDGLRILPFTAEMKSKVWGRGGIGSYIDLDTYEHCNFYLETSYSRSNPRSADPKQELTARSKLRLGVLALRLLHEGKCRAPVHVQWPILFGVANGGQFGPLMEPDVHGWKSWDEYLLSASDIVQLQEMFKTLEVVGSSANFSGLEISFDRFNNSYARTTSDDGIIDIAIALESSLLSGIKVELGYRLSLRGAALLRDTRDPAETAEELKRLYDVRSEIVHGGASLDAFARTTRGKKLLKEVSAHEYSARMHGLLREVIAELVFRVAKGEKVQELTKSLDQLAYTSLRRLPSPEETPTST